MSPHHARLLVLLAALILMIGAWLMLTAPGHTQSAAPCDREPNGHAIVINLDDVKNRETISHVFTALLHGKKRLLHWHPELADANRKASLRGVDKVPGKDLDEYPPAATSEGGAGADVAAIDRSDNRSAGARMGAQLRPYCTNQAFILEP